MVGNSSGSASEAADLKTHKRKGSRAEKTPEQKEAHNASCRKSREKNKRRRVELEEMAKEHCGIQEENRRLKIEQRKNLDLENVNQELKKALQQKAANEERMLQIISKLTANGQKFSSFDELVDWFASQSYGPVGEASDYTSLSPSGAAGSSFGNLHAPNPKENVLTRHPASGFWAAYAPGFSSGTNDHDWFPEFDVLNNDGYESAFIDLANEFLPASAAGSSANDHVFDAPKSNNVHTSEPDADNNQAGLFRLGGDPSSN